MAGERQSITAEQWDANYYEDPGAGQRAIAEMMGKTSDGSSGSVSSNNPNDYITGEANVLPDPSWWADWLKKTGTGVTTTTPVSRSNVSSSTPSSATTFGDTESQWNKEFDARRAAERAAIPSGGPTRSGGGGTTTGGQWGGWQGTAFEPYLKSGVPTYTPPAPYVAPAYDRRRVSALTQQQANPYVSNLHRTILEAIAQSRGESSPIISRYKNEGIMSAYGSSLGKVMGQAAREGANAYQPEYAGLLDASKINYTTQAQVERDKYQAAMNIYNTALSSYLKGYTGARVGGDQLTAGIPT